MAVTTTGTFQAVLKTLYPQKVIKEMAYKDAPFLALVKKEEMFTGPNKAVVVKYASSNGRSATISTAIANKSGPAAKQFLITRSKDYLAESLDREFIRATSNDQGSFVRGVKSVVDGMLYSLNRSLARQLYSDGLCKLGQISAGSNLGSDTITLADISKIVNFEVGMKVVCSAAGATARGGTGTIKSIDRGTGTLTLTSSTWTSVTSGQAGDFIHQEGDLTLGMPGLASWVPTSAPSSESFYGIDRTVDSRLYGVAFSGAGMLIKEALQKGVARQMREGARPTNIFMNPVAFTNLAVELGNEVVYETIKAIDVDLGIESIKLHTPAGTVNVVSDINCDSNLVYSLQMDDWEFSSLDPAPTLFDTDVNNGMIREASTDSYEVRAGYYGALSCERPGHQLVITLDTQS